MPTVFGYDFKKYDSISEYDFDRQFIKLAKEKISKSGDILNGSLDIFLYCSGSVAQLFRARLS